MKHAILIGALVLALGGCAGGVDAPAADAKRFSGEWSDPRGNRGGLSLVADSAGRSSIEFYNTSCRGARPIPAGEIGLADDRFSVLADGEFKIDIGGFCGPADVVVKEISDVELRFDFYRTRHKDTFFATVTRNQSQ